MIIDTYKTFKGRYDADVCIIGSGAAGLTIANELKKTNLKVLILESGGKDFEDDIQDFNRGELAKEKSSLDYPIHDTRQNSLGGTTNLWAGLSAPFTQLDMIEKNWIKYSGWPITRNSLNEYYDRAHKFLKYPSYSYNFKQFPNKNNFELKNNLNIENKIYLFPKILRMRKDLVINGDLKKHKNITFLLHAHCTVVHRKNNSIIKVTCTNLRGWFGTIYAKKFILATGGIGNAQLLLNTANKVTGYKGLGNENDQVGRFFQEHPHVNAGFVFNTSNKDWFEEYQIQSMDNSGAQYWIGVGATDKVQRDYKIPNNCATFQDLSSDDKKELEISKIVDVNFLNLLGQSKYDAKFSNIDLLTKKLIKRLYFRLEQVPNPNSRVLLSKKKNKLGLYRVKLDWRMTNQDYRNINITSKILANYIGQLGIGRVKLNNWQFDKQTWKKIRPDGGCHHMGTTRMGTDKLTSVVDKNCKIHNVNNFFIAGASVFPTSSYVNPTLTIVALSIRLSDHIKKSFS